MYRILLIAMVTFSFVGARGQQRQEYFVFIQETARQPFYVRMGDVSHSSSATGHIILSNLSDSSYNFFIGFPKGRSPEQLFAITMNKKDHGYELRNMDGRWQLFDLQTLQLISPASSSLYTAGQTVMRSDSYSQLMAHVVDDSAVLYSAVEDTLTTDTVKIAAEVKAVADSAAEAKAQPVKKSRQKKPRTAPANDTNAVKTDTANTDTANTVITKAPDTTAVVGAPPQVPSQADSSSVRDKRDIIRLITENVTEGRMMIYVDRTGAVNDTIRIVIPRK